ncbi:hypothetical protein niasHS_004833 [Heterodera schachtii]|uniref:CCHC-type domain-containing protein n=1 Tax=Heterodera schachtii TaxID=97005 RepID=A0ABD2JS98_HETSC
MYSFTKGYRVFGNSAKKNRKEGEKSNEQNKCGDVELPQENGAIDKPQEKRGDANGAVDKPQKNCGDVGPLKKKGAVDKPQKKGADTETNEKRGDADSQKRGDANEKRGDANQPQEKVADTEPNLKCGDANSQNCGDVGPLKKKEAVDKPQEKGADTETNEKRGDADSQKCGDAKPSQKKGAVGKPKEKRGDANSVMHFLAKKPKKPPAKPSDPNFVCCKRCGGKVHTAKLCANEGSRCFRCGKLTNHTSTDCPKRHPASTTGNGLKYWNCGDAHKMTRCPKENWSLKVFGGEERSTRRTNLYADCSRHALEKGMEKRMQHINWVGTKFEKLEAMLEEQQKKQDKITEKLTYRLKDIIDLEEQIAEMKKKMLTK